MIFLPTGPLIVSAFALAEDRAVDGGQTIARISRLAVEACSPASINAAQE